MWQSGFWEEKDRGAAAVGDVVQGIVIVYLIGQSPARFKGT